ncbi:MAG TPA: translation initiation factor IF-2 [Candidatus Babeliales bacterium]|nr:translation initiation factor IF-2 [Candidatus Babeliales bacterium]
MRIYEFAKEHDLSSKDALGLLRREGFEVSNHMAQLSPSELECLQRAVARGDKKALAPSNKKPAEKPSGALEIEGSISLGRFAEKIKEPVSDLISFLLQQGIVCNINQMLTEDAMRKLAEHYEIEVSFSAHGTRKEVEIEKQSGADMSMRSPVVVIVGHVDHGKTSLLDYIRKSRVAEREKGGITQHLGAYEVKTDNGNVIFIDTPGHEAFDKMRMRGVKVADIAILIVAADDGVMPQTVEAIEHARAVGVPIIVAINKIDKVDKAGLESVYAGLSKHGLLSEAWGGDTVCVPVSAKEGTGVDDLLEILALQSEVLELKARASGPGVGYVLESRLEKGRGPVGTLILQHGTAKIGDYFIAGNTGGRISSVVDSAGNRVKTFGVTIPVGVSGFDTLPQAGDVFKIVPFAEYKKAKSSSKQAPVAVYSQLHTTDPNAQVYKIILKVDTNSSKEALVQAIEKLSSELEEESIVIAHTGVGNVSENDISLASTLGAHIYSFGVKTDVGAVAIARRLKLSIENFYVIYHLLDALKLAIEKGRAPKFVEEKTGEAMVLKVFNVKRLGVIAGCQVKDGKIVHGGKVVVYRNRAKVGEGIIKTLQKEKKSQKEVLTGFECAFILDGFSDWQEGDIAECYIQKKVEQ